MRFSSSLLLAVAALVGCGGQSSSSDSARSEPLPPELLADGAGGVWIAIESETIDEKGSAVGFVEHVTADGRVDKKREVPYVARFGPVFATKDALTIFVDDVTRHGYFDAMTDAPREAPSDRIPPVPVSTTQGSAAPIFAKTDDAGRGHVVVLLEVGAITQKSLRPTNSRVLPPPSYDRILVRTTARDTTTIADQIFEGVSIDRSSVSMTTSGQVALGLPNRVVGIGADGTQRFDVAVPLDAPSGIATLSRQDGSAFAFSQRRVARVDPSGAIAFNRTVDFDVGRAVVAADGVIMVTGTAADLKAIRLDGDGIDVWRTSACRCQ